MWRLAWKFWQLAFWAAVWSALSANAEPPRPSAGAAKLASGRKVEYTLHFNRNAIRSSLRIDGGFLASTSSSALLRFESPSMRLVKESILDREPTALGTGKGGEPLVGFADGRICRVDPVSLELTERFKVQTSPVWIGWIGAIGDRPAGLVVVAASSKAAQLGSEVHDLATGKDYWLEQSASAFLVDRSGRLWVGWDNGEWGGGVLRIDLETGIVQEISPAPSPDPKQKPYWSGIHGFIDHRDGQVWAYGGSMHGMGYGFIARIDQNTANRLWRYMARSPLRDDQEGPEAPADPGRPVLPVTQIVEQDDHLLVISYSGVFRVDKALKDWKPVNTLEIQYPWGRFESTGAYAVVVAVHPPTRAGEPYLLATMADGYVALEGEKATPTAVSGQVAPEGMDDVTNSAEGLLLRNRWDLEETEISTVWRFGKDGWKPVDFSPPFEMDPANPEPEGEEGCTFWHFPYVLVGPDGSIVTVNQSGASPGTRTVARWAGGKAIRMGREVSERLAHESFITGDGVLWNDSDDRLHRFRDGQWRLAYDHSDRHVGGLDPIGTKGPPWTLLDPKRQALWRLRYDADGRNTRLVGLKVEEGGVERKVFDAIPWTGNLLLLATDGGLRTFDPAGEILARIGLPEPPAPAHKLARDGLGRLWLGGEEGCWLIDTSSKSAESFEPVPWIKEAGARAQGPDPEHPDGIVAVLGDRAVAFLRAGAKP